MKMLLTVVMCSIINGEPVCVKPYTFENTYNDYYSCMIDGYNKASDKTIELGKDGVNEYKIYIKFGCSEQSEIDKLKEKGKGV